MAVIPLKSKINGRRPNSNLVGSKDLLIRMVVILSWLARVSFLKNSSFSKHSNVLTLAVFILICNMRLFKINTETHKKVVDE